MSLNEKTKGKEVKGEKTGEEKWVVSPISELSSDSSIGKLTPHVLISRFALAAYEFLYIQSIEKSAEKKISVGGMVLGSPQVPNMSLD